MPNLSERDNDPPPDRGKRGLMMPVIVFAVVLIVIVLHLTGVIGPGTH